MALPRFFVLVVATVALLAQSASPWSFQWRDDDGLATIEAGKEKTGCKVIDHGKNQPYEWDPKGGHFCIQVFHDNKCERLAGYSCNPWPHDSTADLKSFKVNGTLTTDEDIWSSTTTKSASTTTSSLTTSAIKDPPPPTDSSTTLPQSDTDDKGNDDSLSGGAIAGIVIGIVAVVVLGIIAWLLFRRYRQTTPQEPSPAGYSASGSVPPMSESGGTTATTTTAVGSAPPIAKWGAPPPPTSPTSPISPEEEPLSPAPAYSPTPQEGPRATAELSNSHQIVELEGSDPAPPIPTGNPPVEKPAR